MLIRAFLGASIASSATSSTVGLPERGDQPYVVFDGGRHWTYRELREKVIAIAAGLQRAGVQRGEHVLCWQPNTPEMLLMYYALNYVGAVYVPINTAYRGGVLEHVIENSDC